MSASNQENPPISKPGHEPHSPECMCATCEQSESGYFGRFQNIPLPDRIFATCHTLERAEAESRMLRKDLMALADALA